MMVLDFKPNGSNQVNDGPLIKLSQVVKTYHGLAGDVTALKGVDLEVRAGEFVAITGKSGSGKTTLINVMTGLDRPTSGQIWVSGTPVHQLRSEKAARWRGQTVGVVFQTFELIPSLSVLHNVTLPMDFANHSPIRRQRQRAMRLLEQVEIADHAHKLPSAVSGGQQQRVAIARVFIREDIAIGLISWLFGAILAYPLGKGLSDAVGTAVIGVPLNFSYSLSGLWAWLILVVILSAIASFIPARNASRLTVREVLAYE